MTTDTDPTAPTDPTAHEPNGGPVVPAPGSPGMDGAPGPGEGDPSAGRASDASDASDATGAARPGEAADARPGRPGPRGGSDLEHEGEVAADYLEGLLDIVDVDGDLDLDVEADRAVVAIVGAQGLSTLVGPDGAVLEALQELTRLAVLTATGNRSRLMLDIAGWRAGRRTALAEQGGSVARRVLTSGEPERLAPMSPFERKVVHDAVAAVDGVHSESEGDEPRRRVVVLPG